MKLTFNDFFQNIDGNVTPNWEFIDSLEEFKAMKTCHHSHRFHTEGSPYNHTKLVVETAIKYLSLSDKDWHYQALLMAALFHDISKPRVTVYDETKKDWSAPFHADKSAKMTRIILFDWPDIEQREYIVNLVRNHMVMHHILEKDIKKIKEKLKIFHNRREFEDSCYLLLFDSLSSIGINDNPDAKRAYFRRVFSLREYVPNKEISTENKLPVYLLIGLPGSGKSTYAEKLIKENNWPEDRVLSRDTVRSILGFCKNGEKYVGSQSEENAVTKYINNKMIEFAKENKPFVIDNTHMFEKYRNSIKETLKNFKISYNFVYIEGPSLSEIINRRENDGFGDKSEEIIYGFLEKFEFPRPYEYDSLIISKN